MNTPAEAEDGERKKERETDNNNGQATHGARKPPGPKEEQTMIITMAKLRMANASTHGAHKPPGPILG